MAVKIRRAQANTPLACVKVCIIKKNIFDFSGAHLPVGSTKCLCTHVLLQNAMLMVKIIEKLGHHPWNLCFVGARASQHGLQEFSGRGYIEIIVNQNRQDKL